MADTGRLEERDFAAAQREDYAKSGVAMPDGSFPIPDEDALRRAIKAIGRAKPDKRDAVRAHIRKRAKALGVSLEGSSLQEGLAGLVRGRGGRYDERLHPRNRRTGEWKDKLGVNWEASRLGQAAEFERDVADPGRLERAAARERRASAGERRPSRTTDSSKRTAAQSGSGGPVGGRRTVVDYGPKMAKLSDAALHEEAMGLLADAGLRGRKMTPGLLDTLAMNDLATVQRGGVYHGTAAEHVRDRAERMQAVSAELRNRELKPKTARERMAADEHAARRSRIEAESQTRMIAARRAAAAGPEAPEVAWRKAEVVRLRKQLEMTQERARSSASGAESRADARKRAGAIRARIEALEAGKGSEGDGWSPRTTPRYMPGLREATDSRSLPDIPKTAAVDNWVEKAGHMPPFIVRIAKHLFADGKPKDKAWQMAVGIAQRVCATGQAGGSGQWNAGSKAEACKAVGQWEALKAKSKAGKLSEAECEVFALVEAAPRERLPSVEECYAILAEAGLLAERLTRPH